MLMVLSCGASEDDLQCEHEELSRVRDELIQQLNVARHDQHTTRANLHATEQTNCDC